MWETIRNTSILSFLHHCSRAGEYKRSKTQAEWQCSSSLPELGLLASLCNSVENDLRVHISLDHHFIGGEIYVYTLHACKHFTVELCGHSKTARLTGCSDAYILDSAPFIFVSTLLTAPSQPPHIIATLRATSWNGAGNV